MEQFELGRLTNWIRLELLHATCWLGENIIVADYEEKSWTLPLISLYSERETIAVIDNEYSSSYLPNLRRQNFLPLKSNDMLNGAMRTAKNPVSKSKASLRDITLSFFKVFFL